MKLHCPNCGAEIAAADINLQTMIAKCVRCNAVFSFGSLIATSRSPHPAPVVGKPPRMTLEDFGGTWSLRWRWFSFIYVLLTFFCIAWDSFLIFWYHLALTMKNTPWLMIVFPVGHIAVGVGLTYSVLTGFFNRTAITISGGILSVRHGPLPWVGNRDLPVNRIDHFITGWSTGGRNKAHRNNRDPTADLSAVTRDGENIRVVGGFSDENEPLFIKQELERKLNLGIWSTAKN